MDKYYQEFDYDEENKFIYTTIFNEYTKLMEQTLDAKLKEQLPWFSMSAFMEILQ